MSIFTGQAFALLTQHGKEKVIAPILEPVLECEIKHITGFDTDQLGTFTRETPRPGTQLDAARRKARMGMELSGLPIGIASEGSFGPDPFAGMFPWNVELVVLIDDLQKIEVVGMAQGAGHSSHLLTGEWSEVEAFATQQDFPQHQLVLRPENEDDTRLHKGIADWQALKSCFEDCQKQSNNGLVFIETDLRAFANPSRMQHIALATQDLLQKIQSCCPECQTPGFWITNRRPGLPCSACGRATSNYVSEVWECGKCKYQSVKSRTDRTSADPQHCSHCNP